MPDPIIDANNESPAKHWWQSRTIWGLIGAAISIYAPKYQPIADLLPAVVTQLSLPASLLFAAYGRSKARKPINNPLPI